jgi:hypothetical protein
MKSKEVLAPGEATCFSCLSAPLRALCLCVKEWTAANRQAGWNSAASLALILLLLMTGCQTPRQLWDSLKGDGFPEWNGQMAGGMRAKSTEVKPSGFFTDRRSEQIEQSLGGGF